jgi:2-dehydro-3-deoxygluconokinase
MTGPGRVLCVGEAMVSLRSHGRLRLGDPLTMSVAGAESNVAIGLARLGHAVSFAGVVGEDELGELVLRTLRAEGVDVEHVRRCRRPTGLLFREQRTSDVAHVEYVRAGSAGSTVDADAVAEAFTDASAAPVLVHVSGVTAALSPPAAAATAAALRLGRECGAVTCLDLNYRRRLWSREDAAAALAPLLADVDVLFASADELSLIPAEARSGPAAAGEVVVTHGAEGAEAFTRDGHVRVPALAVRAVDVVGAGDAFVAGYLSARLDGGDIDERLARGSAVAAVAVAAQGDWEGLPTRTELALLAEDHGGTLR